MLLPIELRNRLLEAGRDNIELVVDNARRPQRPRSEEAEHRVVVRRSRKSNILTTTRSPPSKNSKTKKSIVSRLRVRVFPQSPEEDPRWESSPGKILQPLSSKAELPHPSISAAADAFDPSSASRITIMNAATSFRTCCHHSPRVPIRRASVDRELQEGGNSEEIDKRNQPLRMPVRRRTIEDQRRGSCAAPVGQQGSTSALLLSIMDELKLLDIESDDEEEIDSHKSSDVEVDGSHNNKAAVASAVQQRPELSRFW